MTYGFINFLFLFLSHISFIFSFTYLVFTASISISTLPYSFFFPLPFCSMIFPFMNMSHYRFPLYHHWSIKSHSLVFFPLCLLFPLCSISKLPIRCSQSHRFAIPVLVDLVGFGFVIGFWFWLRLWVVSQVALMGCVEVVGCGFNGLIQVIWVEVVGCGWIMDRVWDWVLIWIEVDLGFDLLRLRLWVLIWIGLPPISPLFSLIGSSCCRSLWLWMVGHRWKWLLLLCCDGCCEGLVFFFFFVGVVAIDVFGFGICWCCCCWCCCCCWSALMLLLLGVCKISA